MKTLPLRLEASIAASPYDPYYEAAFVFCHDSVENYSFSLSRTPDQPDIELRVRDHLAVRVPQLDVRWDGSRLTAWLDEPVASRLDGRRSYEIRVTLSDGQAADVVSAALVKIFEGKRGLQLLA